LACQTPEGIGLVAGALTGRGQVDEVLHTCQNAVERTMKRAGYYDKPAAAEAQP